MDKYAKIIKLVGIFQTLRASTHLLLLITSSQKEVIIKDLDRWYSVTHETEQLEYPRWRGMVWFLWRYPEFRNLFYYRIARDRQFVTRIILSVAKFFFKPMETLYLSTPEIGEGFFIQHGFSTIVAARKIGRNCWINQQVTVGYTDEEDMPTIGDNVHITAGAKVLGNVTIGDNVIVGANAVVLKNVPPNCTVVGVPAYIVRHDGKKVKEPLN